MTIVVTINNVSNVSIFFVFSPIEEAKDGSKLINLNSFQHRSTIPRFSRLRVTIMITSLYSKVDALPNKNESNPLFEAVGSFWITVRKTIPSPKKLDNVIPNAASFLMEL